VPLRSRQKSENAKKTIKTRRRSYAYISRSVDAIHHAPRWPASRLVAGLLVILVGAGMWVKAERALIRSTTGIALGRLTIASPPTNETTRREI
jgi:hypothetical protein